MALHSPLQAEIDPTIYLSLFATLQTPILFIDGQTGGILDANPAACAFYGFSHAELTGKNILELSALTPEDARQRGSQIAAGEIAHMRTRHRLANGEICDVDVALGRHVLGERIINIAVIRDISAQVQAEIVLRESEEKYHGFVSQAYDAFTLTDERGVVIEWNQAAEKLTGIPAGEVLGQFAWDVQLRITSPENITAEMRTQVRQRIEDMLKAGVSPILNTYVTKIKRSDGEEIVAGQKLFTIKTAMGFQLGTIAYDLTQEKQAEATLHESKERFSTIFHASHDAISIARLTDDVYLDVNEAFCSVFGVTREQAIGHTGRELNIAADPAQREEMLRRLRSQGQVTNFEARFRNHVGQTGFLLLSGQIVKVSGQDCLVIFGKDITLRKQAEAALQESEARYRALFENMNEGFALQEIIQDDNGRVVDFRTLDANPAYEKQTGLKLEDVVGHTLREVTPNADPAMIERYGEVALTGNPLSFEYYSKTFDRYMRVRSFRPQVNRFATIFEDITERKLAEQALQAAHDELEQRVAERTAELRQSEEKFSKAFYETPLARALIREADAVIVEVNDRFTELFEYNREQILGHTPFKLGIAPDVAKSAEIKKTVLEQHGSLKNYDVSIVLQSGKRLDLLISTTAINLADGIYHMFAFVDITERKRAEKKLAETNTALEKALRTKDEFMAAMSHELRTPLTSILGMAESLQMLNYGELSEKQLKVIGIIETNGNRLRDMISAVLDYAQLQSEGITVQSKPCNLADLCQTALQTIKPVAARKHQQTHFSIAPEPFTLTTNKQLLLQLLKYLLENASKFTAETGEFGIEVLGDREGKLVMLSVWDKGIGIQEEDIPRLFQPFVQLDASLSRLYEGAGLGLVLVKRIAELLGGGVSVESVFGQGSRFTVALPWLD